MRLAQRPGQALCMLQGVLLGRSFLKLHSIQDAVSVCPSYHSRADIKPSRFIPPWCALCFDICSALIQSRSSGHGHTGCACIPCARP